MYHVQWNASAQPMPDDRTFEFSEEVVPKLIFDANEEYKKRCALSAQDGKLHITQKMASEYRWFSAVTSLDPALLLERNLCAYRISATADTRSVISGLVRLHRPDGSFENYKMRSVVLNPGANGVCDISQSNFREIMSDSTLFRPVLILQFQNIHQDILIDEIAVL